MRDIAFTVIFFLTCIPAATRPWLGLCMWVVMDYMNPHRLCYGWAKYSIPFSMIATGVTFFGLLVAQVPKRLPLTRETILLLCFILWMSITTVTALNPRDAQQEWDRAVKIQLLILMTLVIVYDRFRLDALVWAIAGSLAFYGIKGGISTILRGGSYKIFGPEYTFIYDNNDLALALVTTIPLLRYLMLQATNRWIRNGLGVAMLLIAVSVIGSYSRGGMLGLSIVTALMIWKSRKRILFGSLVLSGIYLTLQIMPQEWFDRMNTVKSYDTDNSVLGRFNAWQFGWNLVLDYPITGGGFRTFTKDLFLQYAPNPEDHHEAHNIFVKIMAEHGFIGIGIFLLMAFLAWRSASWVRRISRQDEELTWAGDLASMLQVSMAGYAVGGALLNLAYFDLPYHLIVMCVIAKLLVREHLAAKAYEQAMHLREREFAPPAVPVGQQLMA